MLKVMDNYDVCPECGEALELLDVASADTEYLSFKAKCRECGFSGEVVFKCEYKNTWIPDEE